MICLKPLPSIEGRGFKQIIEWYVHSEKGNQQFARTGLGAYVLLNQL